VLIPILYLPEREIMTGIGPVAVRQPRVRDREAVGGERIRFSPSKWRRRTPPRYAALPLHAVTNSRAQL
jgi:hypothetical protein